MKKFLIALLSIVLMFGAVGLTACGSSGSGGNDTNNDGSKEAEKEIEGELDNVVLEFSEEEELFGRNGNVITLGEYPQKLKTDKSEITDEQNEKGYYKGTNGCWYAKVTVENIAEEGIFFSTSKEDKVVVGETYYFLVEPLRWRIVEEKDGSALLLCDNIIDCVPYQSLYTTDIVNEENNDKDYFTTANGAPEGTYANNYEYSDLREFLNEDFYEKAFSEKEKQLIKDTVVENGINSLSDFCLYKTVNNEKVYFDTDTINSTLANDTTDKVFALSYEECTRESYGFEHRLAYLMFDGKKEKLTTDYAKAKGSYASKNATVGLNYSAGFWMTRSPFYDEYNTGNRFSIVSPTGGPAGQEDIDKMIYHPGVVPAINIELKKGASGGIAAYKSEDEQSYIIKSIGKATDTEIAIPEKINGLPVTEIAAEAFKDNTAITSVSLPSTINSIGKDWINGCSNLQKIAFGNIDQYLQTIEYIDINNIEITINGIIPEQVKNIEINNSTRIEREAFLGWSSLTSVTIGNSVTSIGRDAFSNCSSLTNVVIGNSVTSIGQQAFYGCSKLTKVNYTGTIDQWCKIRFDAVAANPLYANPLYKAKNLYINDQLITETNITTATNINGAFYNCSSLTSVTIGNSVTSIGKQAFFNCSGLTSITIPDSVTSIGSSAFYNCSKLTSITIPDSVTSIGSEAFRGCSSLTSVIIGNSVASIGSSAFYNCSKLTSIIIPDSVTIIGGSAFYNCSKLTSVTIGNSVTSIGACAFEDCCLTSITIPNSVTDIGPQAFRSSGLARIYYTGTPIEWTQIDGLEYLISGRELYINNEILTNVVLENITEIKPYAFFGCWSLTSITILNGVKNIGDRAFYGCSKLVEVINKSDLTITKGSTHNGYIGCYALTIHNGESKIVNKDGYLFITDDDGANYLLGHTGQETELTLPSDYNGENYQIYDEAFINCRGLTSITIPNSVTSIGNEAFSCSSLTSITIPDSVTSIGSHAFSYSSLTSVIIGNSVASIGYAAFFNCSSLTSITIPDSVTSIGGSAFEDCSSLTKVYYNGTASDWSEIMLGSSNSPLTTATRYYFSETQPTETGNYWHYVEGVPTVW